MDQRAVTTAKDLVNGYSEKELYRVIREHGEEKFARDIARRIVAYRVDKPIETTGELAGIIKEAIPVRDWRMPGHPAKRTFQALRIELNRELEVLRDSLEDMIKILNPKGRICVITFHSLEDRIVKNIFKKSEDPCTCPKTFPVCVCGKRSLGRVMTRRPIVPSQEEMEENRRSRSAKLRIFERGE